MAKEKLVSQDILFGSLVVKKGLASHQEVKQCLEEVKRRRKAGEELSLADIMVSQGLVDPSQAKEILEFQVTKLTTCPQCKSIYNIEKLAHEKKIRCKKCSTIIVVDKSEGSKGSSLSGVKKEDSTQTPRKTTSRARKIVPTFAPKKEVKEEIEIDLNQRDEEKPLSPRSPQKIAPTKEKMEEIEIDIDIDDEEDSLLLDPEATAAFPSPLHHQKETKEETEAFEKPWQKKQDEEISFSPSFEEETAQFKEEEEGDRTLKFSPSFEEDLEEEEITISDSTLSKEEEIQIESQEEELEMDTPSAAESFGSENTHLTAQAEGKRETSDSIDQAPPLLEESEYEIELEEPAPIDFSKKPLEEALGKTDPSTSSLSVPLNQEKEEIEHIGHPEGEEESSEEREAVAAKEESSEEREAVAAKEESSEEREAVAAKEEPSEEREAVAVQEESSEEREAVAVQEEPSEEREAVAVQEESLQEEKDLERETWQTTTKKEAFLKAEPATGPTFLASLPFSKEKWETIEKTSRIATITYFDQVYLQRTYPIKVRFSIQNHFVARMAWKLELRGENQLNPLASTFQIVPIIPGAYLTPPSLTLSALAPVGEVEFWMTPFRSELLKASKIQIWYQGHMIDEVSIPMKACSQGMTGIAIFSGIFFLVAPLVGPALMPNLTRIFWTKVAYTSWGAFLLSQFGSLGKPLILLSIVFFFLSFLAYLQQTQRRKQKGRKFALRPSLETFSFGVGKKLDQISFPKKDPCTKNISTMDSGTEKTEKAEDAVFPQKESHKESINAENKAKTGETENTALNTDEEVQAQSQSKGSSQTPSFQEESMAEEKTEEKNKIECGKDLEKFFQIAQEGKEATALAAVDNVTLSYFTTNDGYFVKRVIILGENARPELLGEEMRVAYKPGEFKKEWLGGLRESLEDFEGGLRQILESLESKKI